MSLPTREFLGFSTPFCVPVLMLVPAIVLGEGFLEEELNFAGVVLKVLVMNGNTSKLMDIISWYDHLG